MTSGNNPFYSLESYLLFLRRGRFTRHRNFNSQLEIENVLYTLNQYKNEEILLFAEALLKHINEVEEKIDFIVGVASTDRIEKLRPSALTAGEYNGQQDLPDQKTIDSYNLEVFHYESEKDQYQKELKEKIRENLDQIRKFLIKAVEINSGQKLKNRLMATDTHLSVLKAKSRSGPNTIFNLLLDNNFISEDDTAIKSFFKGKDISSTINWKGSIVSLQYFIKSLIKEKIIEDTKRKHWFAVSNCFLVKGNRVTNNQLVQASGLSKSDEELIDRIIQNIKKL